MQGDRTLRRRLAAIVVLALVPLAAWLARGVVVDNRLERWVAPTGAEERHYADFRRAFGSDELIVVTVTGPPLFEPAALAAMTDCLGRLEAVPGVVRVQGLPQLYRDLFGGEDPDELRREMTSTPFYTGLLLSADATTAALLVEVAPPEAPEGRRRMVAEIRAATTPLVAAGCHVALVGSTVLIVALDELSVREATQTFPLAVLGSLLVLAVLLRSPRAMAAVAASSGVAVLLTLGVVVAAGGSLNMLTAALPSLLWVLGLSYAVHLVSRFRNLESGLPRADALDRALAETRTGVAFSAVTTILGFASLLVATMPPVRELGVFGAVGIGLAWMCSRTVTPLLLELLRVPAARPRVGSVTPLVRHPLPLRAPAVVLAVAAAIALAAVASVPRIRLESNPLSFLPDDHPVTLDYRFVGSRVAGFYTAETVVRLPGPWTDPASWPVLDAIARELAASPVVSRVVTPLDLLRKLRQWDQAFDPAAYRLPAGRAEAERLVGQLDATGRSVLASLVAPSGREVRLSAVVREMDELRFLDLVQGARESLARLPAGFDGYVTGQVLRLVTAQQNLIATQLGSLGLAFAVIFAAIWVGLRSARLTGVAIPSNLLPVAVVFATMAWLDIPLDAGTVMVASVSLGIAVDNTIHYLVEYCRALARGAGRLEAAGAALALVRPAIATATVAACTGFAALTVSAFRPIRTFGLLATVMLVVGLAAHLLVTPAILALRRQGEDREMAP
ncbi:MAG: MMPL family transporter [Thermoanaerobaculaceae bacterium]|jgi:hypothetical protein|nr:MMPL family transporter [Thermoanaerobaculaceae bacterium]